MQYIPLAGLLIGVAVMRKSIEFADVPHPVAWAAGMLLIYVSGIVIGVELHKWYLDRV